MAKPKHTIRIISGTHRSRRLPVLDSLGLRPTGNRIRETLFNWLQLDIVGKSVLDLCAGSGALGFEAASRGAQKVTLIERNSEIANQLIQIQNDFEFKNSTVVNVSAQHFIKKCESTYDIVLIDPPFADDLMQELTALTVPLVNAKGFIYREAAVDTEFVQLDKNWQLFRQKTFGQVKIELWKKLY